MVESESVWRALSSSHRRKLLELMRNGPQTTGQLCQAMPELTRFAVMQHLGVLASAGLVLIRREGRNRLNFSNASKLWELFDEWVNPMASRAAESAQHLRQFVEFNREANRTVNESKYRHVDIELETRIEAPVERVFQALTAEYPKWWPHSFREGAEIYHDNRVGGTLGERWPDGGGVAYGTIMWLQLNTKIVTVNVGLFGDYTTTNRETLEADGDATIYRKSMHLWGDVPADVENMLRNGARELAEKNLKAYCEGG